jgi:hypothetical protein
VSVLEAIAQPMMTLTLSRGVLKTKDSWLVGVLRLVSLNPYIESPFLDVMRSFATLLAFVTALSQALAHGGQGFYEIDGVQYDGWAIDPDYWPWGEYDATNQRYGFVPVIHHIQDLNMTFLPVPFNVPGLISIQSALDNVQLEKHNPSLLIDPAASHR